MFFIDMNNLAFQTFVAEKENWYGERACDPAVEVEYDEEDKDGGH